MSSTPPPGTSSRDSSSSPTLWIALTAVFAIAAVGLGIWGFTKSSDLSDAKDTSAEQQRELATQKEQLASQEEQAGQTERKDVGIAERTKARYRRTRKRLLAEDKRGADLDRDVRTQKGQLAQAREDVATADSQDERLGAQLKAANAATDVAAACARRSVDALDRFFAADDAGVGADHAVRSLRRLQAQCRDVVSD